MKKLIIFISLLICSCAQSDYLKNKINPELTTDELDKMNLYACNDNARAKSNYKGYQYLCCSEGFWDYCTSMIFDPNGQFTKLVPESVHRELIAAGGQQSIDRYLQRFVAQEMGTKDYSDIAEYSPLLAIKMAEYDSMKKQYLENKRSYDNLANQWDASYKSYKGTENQFLKSLTIEQLELYAKYEDASKENKAALKELYSRKVQNSLTAEQKEALIEQNNHGSNLEILNNRLIEKKESLDIAKIALDKSEQEYKDIMYAELARSRSVQPSSMQATQPSSMQVLADGLGDMAENIRKRSYQQQQQYQMYQINSSLQEISRTLRGF